MFLRAFFFHSISFYVNFFVRYLLKYHFSFVCKKTSSHLFINWQLNFWLMFSEMVQCDFIVETLSQTIRLNRVKCNKFPWMDQKHKAKKHTCHHRSFIPQFEAFSHYLIEKWYKFAFLLTLSLQKQSRICGQVVIVAMLWNISVQFNGLKIFWNLYVWLQTCMRLLVWWRQ